MEADKTFVYFQAENQVATVTFDRPPLNLFTLDVFRDFERVFDELITYVNRDEVRVVILRSAIPKSFSAGDDVIAGPQTSDEAIRENDIARAVMKKIHSFPVPVIAAVDGYALGGGLVLAMMADYVIASDRAKFGFGEIDFGMFPNWGTTFFLAHSCPLPQMKQLLTTGERFGAQEALQYNLVQNVVPAEELAQTAGALAGVYSSKAPIAVRAIKTLMNTALDVGEDGHYALESFLTKLTFDSEDVVEGTKAFEEKRMPVFHNH